MRSHHSFSIWQTRPAIEVSVVGPTERLAFLLAEVKAKEILAFIGTGQSSSLIHCESASLRPNYIAYNQATNNVQSSFHTTSRLVLIDPNSQRYSEYWQTLHNDQSAFDSLISSAPELHSTLSRASRLLYRAKTMRDPSTKQLLLVVALETLLLEKKYPGKITQVFKSRLKVAAGQGWEKIQFLAKLYSDRSAFVHAGDDSKDLEPWEYDYLERFVHGMILCLARTGETNHVKALERQGLLIPPAPTGKIEQFLQFLLEKVRH